MSRAARGQSRRYRVRKSPEKCAHQPLDRAPRMPRKAAPLRGILAPSPLPRGSLREDAERVTGALVDLEGPGPAHLDPVAVDAHPQDAVAHPDALDV
jgi:hypothetical protein